MIVMAIAEESTISNLESYRAQLARLADPRGLSVAEKARLIHEAKPIYWLSGSIHSPETGSPEMLMELAYRLAVDDSENARTIRSNVITLITPVTEVDGRHTLAYQEITELTRRGLPGIWTHGFYDGWAPNYTLLSVANLHNSIGRFYETYTSSGANCTTVRLPATDTARRWDRPNPPVNGIRWCIRSNINYQQSGALIALKYTADHR